MGTPASSRGGPASLVDALFASFSAALRYAPGDAEPPAALLWPDPEGLWAPLVPLLRSRRAGFLTLGKYDPAKRTGPVVWLRAALARRLTEVVIPEGETPVLYLPQVERQTLREGEGCPAPLRPLVELQHRGVVWAQRSGREWTPEGFVGSEEGLSLDVDGRAETRVALRRALPRLADLPASELRGRRLYATDFDGLLVGDTVGDLLRWLDDPEGFRRASEVDRWAALRDRLRSEYRFDPDHDGPLVGAERLGLREGAWAGVWERFAQAASSYPRIPALLAKARPPGLLVLDPSSWPDLDAEAERDLRSQLESLANSPRGEAAARIAELERRHGPRREYVWARLGRSPLAKALQFLSALAEATATAPGGEDPEAMAVLQAATGHRADLSALDALASATSDADRHAVSTAVRALYLPWLDEGCRRLQALGGPPSVGEGPSVREGAGTCLLFSDGLRFDLAVRLADRLRARDLNVEVRRRWAALPTVTATAKHAASPIVGELGERGDAADFLPAVAATGKPLTTEKFRDLLRQAGYEVLAEVDRGGPSAPEARAWAEIGDLDRRGHDMGVRMVGLLEEELDRIVERVVGLVEAGWRRVRVLTDHGWLLMPGALPKVDLPAYLTASKWSRCALVKGNSAVEFPTFPWRFDPTSRVAMAPGASCFAAGKDYAHGGVSLQECLLADLIVEPASAAGGIGAAIETVEWTRLRCKVRVRASAGPVFVDLRLRASDPGSSVAAGRKELDGDGTVGVLVQDERHQGVAVEVVVCDASGRVLARTGTTVPKED